MVPLCFGRARIAELLARASEQLEGQWLLIGGAAAAAWFAPSRTTEDLDLIGLAGTQSERFALMQFALDVSLPVEAVNSAADFFVRRVVGWQEELIELVRGSKATIYRPSATLFLLLKIGRLTTVDLEDCLALIEHCATSGEQIDRERVRAQLDALLVTDDVALAQRRAQLRAALS